MPMYLPHRVVRGVACILSCVLCADKQCPQLEAPKNGRLSTSDRGCNTSVSVNCEECYSLEGYNTLTCQSNGTWTESVGTCNGKLA